MQISAVFSGTAPSSKGLFSAKIEIMVDREDGEGPYLSSEVTSAAVFHTEIEAKAGAARAIKKFDTDGIFPNMCEAF